MLYIITAGNKVKVGICTQGQLSRRLSNLQTGNGEQLEIFGLFYGYGRQVEQAIHTKFDGNRIIHYNPMTGKRKSKKSEWLAVDAAEILRYIADNDYYWRDMGCVVTEEIV